MRILSHVVLPLAVFSVIVSSAAHSTEDYWRCWVCTDDNHGYYKGTSQLGFYTTSLDGYDFWRDQPAPYLQDPLGNAWTNWCTAVIPGRTEAFHADVKAPIASGAPVEKKWDLRVYTLHSATNSDIRLWFTPVNTDSSLLPPRSFNGVAVRYYLKMVNNRGVIGAPANETNWALPIPTVAETTNTFFSLVMPTGYGTGGPDIILTDDTYAYSSSEGYVMEYGFEPVPEPSALLALGIGLLGLSRVIQRERH